MQTDYKLSNGIRVLMQPMASVRSFAIGVYCRACSNFEADYPLGIAHLIEHMNFKGTESYTARQIAEIIDDIGGTINAYTSKDCTAFYAKVLYQNADIPIKLLADMLQNSTITEKDIADEIEVVKEEIAECNDDPDDLCYELFQKQAFKGHALAEPILGYVETIQEIKRADIKRFQAEFYKADNIVISCAGYLPENLIELLEEQFGGIASGGYRPQLAPPSFNSGYRFLYKDIKQQHLCLGFKGIKYSDSRFYAMHLISNILGGNASSILYQKIREENSLSYSISSEASFFFDAGTLTIHTSFQSANRQKVIALIAESIQKLADDFNQSVLDKAKNQLKGEYILALESSMARMAAYGKRAVLDTEIMTIDQIIEQIDAINLQTIEALIKEIFSSDFALSMVGRINQAEVETVYQSFKNLLGDNNDSNKNS